MFNVSINHRTNCCRRKIAHRYATSGVLPPMQCFAFKSQIYYNKTRLQCARSACALGTGLTRPFRDDIGRHISIHLCKELTMY